MGNEFNAGVPKVDNWSISRNRTSVFSMCTLNKIQLLKFCITFCCGLTLYVERNSGRKYQVQMSSKNLKLSEAAIVELFLYVPNTSQPTPSG